MKIYTILFEEKYCSDFPIAYCATKERAEAELIRRKKLMAKEDKKYFSLSIGEEELLGSGETA